MYMASYIQYITYTYIHTVTGYNPDQPQKEIIIMQQNLLRSVWNLRQSKSPRNDNFGRDVQDISNFMNV